MAFDAPATPTTAGSRRPLLITTWLLVALGVTLLAILSQQVERTPDELNYQLSGRRLVAGAPPDRLEDRFQGPLIFLGTQLSDAGGKLTDDATLRRARLGMLAFPALLLVVLAFWTRAALGPKAGALAAALGAINPSMLAYGPLLSSDVAFTALMMLASCATWRWLQRPSVLRLLAMGVAFGGVVATKYTAALTVVGLVIVVLVHVCFGFDAWPLRSSSERRQLLRRFLGALTALVVVGAVALVTLYSAYLFTVAPLSTAALGGLQSDLLRAVSALPGGGALLQCLPETMVLGVDFQLGAVGDQANGVFGDLRENHWAYYPVTLLLKVPESVLVLALLAVLSGRVAERARGLWSTVLAPALLVLGYCSATRALQMGVRYVLPMVPALVMLASAFASRRSGWISNVIVVILIAPSAWQVSAGWPHFVGYFNELGGGQKNGFRLVANGNCSWGQARESGRAALRARHADLEVLSAASSPRFGKLAVWWADLKAPDPRAPGRCYHWLTRFDPVDHAGAAWLVFDVEPEDFERSARAGDSRAAVDLAMAWVRERNFEEARSALSLAGPSDPAAGQAQAWADQLEAAGDNGAARDMIAKLLLQGGHPELALELMDRSRRTNAFDVALCLWTLGRQLEAIDHLDRAGADGSRTTIEVLLLAESLVDGGDSYAPDPARALEYMQKHTDLGRAPAAGAPGADQWRKMRARVEAAVSRERDLEVWR